MLEEKIEQDLKQALLAGDGRKVTTLRGLKSVLLNYKISSGQRQTGLKDDEVLVLLSKEAKKRQESADLYVQGGDQSRAAAELAEKAIIEAYLPAALSEAEVAALVDEAIAQTGAAGAAGMGQVIAAVRAKAGAAAAGALIAKIAKEKLGA